MGVFPKTKPSSQDKTTSSEVVFEHVLASQRVNERIMITKHNQHVICTSHSTLSDSDWLNISHVESICDIHAKPTCDNQIQQQMVYYRCWMYLSN